MVLRRDEPRSPPGAASVRRGDNSTYLAAVAKAAGL